MNKRRNTLIIVLGVLLIMGSFSFFSCKKTENVHDDTIASELQETAEKEILYYTCGMHPSVRVKPEDYEAGNNGRLTYYLLEAFDNGQTTWEDSFSWILVSGRYVDASTHACDIPCSYDGAPSTDVTP